MIKTSAFAAITVAVFFSACTAGLAASSTNDPQTTTNAAGRLIIRS